VERGEVGFKPRVVGTPVWIDNISARSIEAFSYQGPPRPLGVHYAPESMVTDWQVLVPPRDAVCLPRSTAAGSIIHARSKPGTRNPQQFRE
jgi:hypothetical protein